MPRVNINTKGLFRSQECSESLPFPEDKSLLRCPSQALIQGVTIIANSSADYLHSWLYIAVKALEDYREENGI